MHLILLLNRSLFRSILVVDLETIFAVILLHLHGHLVAFVLELLLELMVNGLGLLIVKHFVFLAE